MTYAQSVTDPTAVMGRRIGAYAIDTLIGLVLLLFMLVPLLASLTEERSFASTAEASDRCQVVNDATFDTEASTDGNSTSAFDASRRYCIPAGDTTYEFTGEDVSSIFAALYVVSFLTSGLNSIVLQGLTGASIGKFMTGLRVVREDGRRVGFGWNLLRQLLTIVDGICGGIVGLIVALTSKGHRRVGDMAASTYVVGKADMGTPIRIPGVSHQAAWPSPGGYPSQAAHSGPGNWPPGGTGSAGPGGPDGWASPPAGGPTGTWAPSGSIDQMAPASMPGADGPTWDPARDAYIQYDHEQAAWLQWNDSAKSWRPIDQ